jgi:DNA-binding winged helix-turn-helix (wHTH) protein
LRRLSIAGEGMAFRFADFELDQERRQLLRSGRPVPLEPKAYELLSVLVARRPRTLSRDQIRHLVWSDAFVSESTLSQAVNCIRRALDDDARRPRFIRTAHRFGYAFCAEARDTNERSSGLPPMQLRLVWGDRVLSLRAGENLLGRDKEAAVCLDAASVSRHHARILVEGSRATLEDLGSKNGTSLNGERLRGARELRDGDSLRLGHVQLLFRSLPFDGSTGTDRGDPR